MMTRSITLGTLAFIAACASARQPVQPTVPTPWFYRGLDYGSEAQFGPLNVILNEGFGILQLDNRDRHVFRYDYALNARSVLRSAASPGGAIHLYGWNAFLTQELFPLSGLRGGGAQWAPNYGLHLIGGGMVTTRLTEWYRSRGVSYPAAAAVTTFFAGHFINEMIENNGSSRIKASIVADLDVFNAAGFFVFRSDRVRRYFSETLRFTNWGLQPVFDLHDAKLENVGQWYVIRPRFGGGGDAEPTWSPFVMAGMGALVGASRSLGRGRGISFAAGAESHEVVVVDSVTSRETVAFRMQFGAFYDRENSLMASLRYQSAGREAVTLNLYPGTVRIGSWKPGLWLGVAREHGLQIGITATALQGVGPAVTWRR